MWKLKPLIENNNSMIAFYITILAGLFWIFNIYATGNANKKVGIDNVKHIGIHCLKIDKVNDRITEREVFDAMMVSKLDVLLMIGGIDPNKIPTNEEYLSSVRSSKAETDSLDYIKMQEIVDQLTFSIE